MSKYLRLYRNVNGIDSTITIKAPFNFNHIDEGVAWHLNAFVRHEHPEFEICEFLWETELDETWSK